MELLMLCLKIFFVRILDVSLGTFRTIITVKGKRLYASLIGLIEVFIWFVVVKEALNTPETSLWIAISYSFGFATGTYLGSLLSSKFISGNLSVQVITNDTNNLVEEIRNKGFAVTVIDVKGKNEEEEKHMLFIEINKKKFDSLQKLIKKLDHDAFIVVNETKYVQNGFMGQIVK